MNVTIAICTWNRAALLADTLETLSQIRVPAGIEWECLIVNNSCTDNTNDVVASFARSMPMRALFEPMPGLSRARNHAVREARGDLILFTDDDVQLDCEWMSAYVEAAARWPQASYFGGMIEPRYQSEPPAFVTANLKLLQGMLACHDYGSIERVFGEYEEPWGGNMAIRRSVFAQFLFDESLGHRHEDRVMGEESDLFDKLRALKHLGVWVPGAHVKHLVPANILTAEGVRRHFHSDGRTMVRMGNIQHTRILRLPRWMIRALCGVANKRIERLRASESSAWVPLLARCAMWEGMLDESSAAARAAQNQLTRAADE